MFFHPKMEDLVNLSDMPKVETVREKIESVELEEARFCLMAESFLRASQ